jgi:hypothetical protein
MKREKNEKSKTVVWRLEAGQGGWPLMTKQEGFLFFLIFSFEKGG